MVEQDSVAAVPRIISQWEHFPYLHLYKAHAVGDASSAHANSARGRGLHLGPMDLCCCGNIFHPFSGSSLRIS
jgi:hypothetical protein